MILPLFTWIVTTYFGAITLTCNVQPQPTYTAAQSLTCLAELDTGASKRFWLISGWFAEVRQWGGDAGETY